MIKFESKEDLMGGGDIGMGLLDQGCTCEHCANLTRKNLQIAREKWWSAEQREIVFKSYHYSCGDGCCDEYGTNVYINGFELNCDGENVEQVVSNLMEFLGIDNVSVDIVYEDESL